MATSKNNAHADCSDDEPQLARELAQCKSKVSILERLLMHHASEKWDAEDHAALLQASLLSYRQWRSDKEGMRSRWNTIGDEDWSRYVESNPNDYTNICLWKTGSCLLSRTAASRLPGLPTRHCAPLQPRPECVRA